MLRGSRLLGSRGAGWKDPNDGNLNFGNALLVYAFRVKASLTTVLSLSRSSSVLTIVDSSMLDILGF